MKHEKVYQTDDYPDDPIETESLRYYSKMFAIGLGVFVLSCISIIVYYAEVNEFGNDIFAFMIRHANFFGPAIALVVIVLIIQKARK